MRIYKIVLGYLNFHPLKFTHRLRHLTQSRVYQQQLLLNLQFNFFANIQIIIIFSKNNMEYFFQKGAYNTINGRKEVLFWDIH